MAMSVESDYNIPDPYSINEVISSRWSLSGALMELVDNSIAHGKAKHIKIYISNSRSLIRVEDDGIGIEDINLIYKKCRSPDRKNLSQIGVFGVGATNATVWLGRDVTTSTVRDGVRHIFTWNWDLTSCDEDNTTWVKRYKYEEEKGTPVTKPSEVGTSITIKRLRREYYKRGTSEQLAKDFGLVFAPALRAGVKIDIIHLLKVGETQSFSVEPFEPTDLTDEIQIGGEFLMSDGKTPLRWSGRAGMSKSLTEKYNQVHIAFTHRVIESTRDPFTGRSAPEVYVDVQLDPTTPWKFQLSPHKDAIVWYRSALVESINKEILPLIKKAANRAQHIQLNIMMAAIGDDLLKGMLGSGILSVDPDEDPEGGGGLRNGKHPNPNPNPPPSRFRHGKRLRTPKINGNAAKAVQLKRPTGIQIDWRTKKQLEDRAYHPDFGGGMITLLLDKDMFLNVLNWNPKQRDIHNLYILSGYLAQAVEHEYMHNPDRLQELIVPRTFSKLEAWAATGGIAPYLVREIIENSSK